MNRVGLEVEGAYVDFRTGEDRDPLVGERVWFQAEGLPKAVMASIVEFRWDGDQLSVLMDVSAEDAELMNEEWVQEGDRIPRGSMRFESIPAPQPIPSKPPPRMTYREGGGDPPAPSRRRWWQRP